MSLGYAERLSYREDLGGQLGSRELNDSPDKVVHNIELLAEWVKESKNVVAFTGAGISTACGIPDFRGPNGVWTCQRAGKPLPKLHTSFTYAKPSLTHQALLALMQSGKLQYICSQNVDSLHLRSGVPRAQLAELHGNCFAERCSRCGTEYIRDFEMETVGFKPTGRLCSQPGCAAPLQDHILDWEDALPEDELQASESHADTADVAICLGTSLQITPACDIPLRTVKAGGRLAIINLQKTPKDRRAQLVVHARVDSVMALLMELLGMQIPAYVRQDKVLVSHELLKCSGGSGAWGLRVCVSSAHGKQCQMPMVQAVKMQLQMPGGSSEGLPGGLAEPVGCEGPPPFCHTWQGLPVGVRQVVVQLQLQVGEHADEDKRQAVLSYAVHLEPLTEAAEAAGCSSGRGQVFALTTQMEEYTERQQHLVAELREQAAAVVAAGQQGGGATGGKRKRRASGDGGGGAVAGAGYETRPHTTRTGRKTTAVVIKD